MKNTSFKVQILALAILGVLPVSSYAAASCSTQCDALLNVDNANNSKNDDAPSVPGELLVQFKSNATETDKKRVKDLIRAEVGDTVHSKDKLKGDLVIMKYQPDFTTKAAKGAIESDSAVEFAEPNYIYTHQVTPFAPNDYFYNLLWGMQSDGEPNGTYGSQASTAWVNRSNCLGSNTKNPIYVGIIDEGYMYTHVDLAANAGKNPGEIAGNKKDDDKNGYIDDVYGWDFDGNNNSVFDGINDDHGTHVAGTIGAVGNNTSGVAGMCWQVKLLNAKFLGNLGGTTANAIKAVDYFTKFLKNKGVNIATNNSWGGGGFSQGLKDAIERANTVNILFVVAAGNNASNNDTAFSYPASYDNSNIISVASIVSDGTLSNFSNYGAVSVDLGAPGSSIASTIPVKSGGSVVSGYAYMSGTSMATPHVTGAVALYAANNPGATAVQIKAAILKDTTLTSSLSGKTVTGGRLNVSSPLIP